MRKIPTLYLRDPENMSRVTDQIHPDCQWVLDGEGVATRKYDGTCVMLDDNREWWARREVKPGKTPPPNFQAIETDETTGKTVGWEPIEQSSFVKFHTEALSRWSRPKPGTYELCGPKINGNPEGFDEHVLIEHVEAEEVQELDTPEATIRALARMGVEGVVWHHPDGRMAKLKGRDYGEKP